MMPLGVLIALDDLFVRHLGEAVAIAHALHILNRRTRRLVDLPEANCLLGRNGWDEPNRDQDCLGPLALATRRFAA